MAALAPRAPYTGELKAVIFDWAGTILDYGSCAPVVAFREVFRREGVPISVTVARGPMGKSKRDHVSSIIYDPAIAAEWQKVKGAAPTEADIDRMYAAFTPIQVEAAGQRTEPIPGVVALFAALRGAGIAIGSCSGYNDEIMAAVMEGGKAKGLNVDAMECARGANGRPKPWMSVACAMKLDAWPLFACVKVDDTIPGIAEGLNAGMWSVGVVRSGNGLGLDEPEADELQKHSPAEYEQRMEAARQAFREAGAHFIIDSVSELEGVLVHVRAALAQGLRP
jgi:phosphonoacetaldehyde hydrolase